LKPSGIDWLGEIPAHWELVRLKFLATIRTGLTIGKDYGAKELSEYYYLRVANVQDGYLDLSDVTKVLVSESEAAGCLLKMGDVLMNEGGDIDKLGRGCVWKAEIEPCLHQNHVFAVRPHSVDSEWLAMWTSTLPAKSYFEQRAKRTTNLASISSTNIKEISVPLPPPGEQKAILDFIAEATAHFDDVKATTLRSIDLLRERRSAVITTAVTGQLALEEMTP
jgi:type I restriction enzyme S subunit